jgi:hypothetical protein
MVEQSGVTFIKLLTLKIQGIPSWHGTLIKREMISNLIRMSLNWTQRVSCGWIKSSSHSMRSYSDMVPVPSRLARYFSLFVGAPIVLTTDFRGDSCHMDLGRLYNLGGLEPCGHNCLATSSGCEDPSRFSD